MGEIAINPVHNVFKNYKEVIYVNPYLMTAPAPVIVENTFIGGVASTIYTAQLLATKLAIDVSRITNFSVLGSDIKCKITGGYVIPINAFASDTTITYFRDADSLITDVLSNAFKFPGVYGSKIKRLELKGLINLTGTSIDTDSAIEYILLENCVSIPDNAFITNFKHALIYYLPRCTAMGTTSGNNNVFNSTNRLDSVSIYVNPSLATNNGGSPDGDITNAISLGANVVYVANFTVPNPVTTLVSDVVYDKAVLLDFTIPTGSANAIDFYEVYVDGVLNNIGYNNIVYAKDLSPNTNYVITVKTIDVFYNKSTESNSVNVTTVSSITTNPTTDADATTYIANASLSNNYEKESVSVLIKKLKQNAIYSKTQAIYPFKGNTASQHKFNAKNPVDTDAAFRLVFNGAATFSENGYQLNGSSYANTKFSPSINQSLNDNGFTIVIGTNNAPAGTIWDIGSYSGGSQTSLMRVKANESTFERTLGLNSTAGYALQTGLNEARGIWTGSKKSATVHKFVRNGTNISNGTGGGTLPSVPFFIGCLNVAGSPSSYSNQRFQTVIFHEGFTDREIEVFHKIIDLSEIIQGRKTW